MKSTVAALLLLFSCLAGAQQSAQINVQQIQEGHGGSYAIIGGREHKGANIDIVNTQQVLILYIYTYHPVKDGDSVGDELWLSGAASFGDRFTDLIDGFMEIDITMFRGAPAGEFYGTGLVELGEPVGEAILRWTGDQCDEPSLKLDIELNGIPYKSPPGGFPLVRLTEDDGCCLGCILNADSLPQVDPGWRNNFPGWENACPLSAIGLVGGGLPVHVRGSDGQDVCLTACAD